MNHAADASPLWIMFTWTVTLRIDTSCWRSELRWHNYCLINSEDLVESSGYNSIHKTTTTKKIKILDDFVLQNMPHRDGTFLLEEWTYLYVFQVTNIYYIYLFIKEFIFTGIWRLYKIKKTRPATKCPLLCHYIALVLGCKEDFMFITQSPQ